MRACTYCKKILPAADTHCPDDDSLALEVEANAALPPAPAELTTRFGRLEPYALGSSGIAYLAADDAAHGRTLVKVLHPGYADAGSDRARAKRELQKQLTIMHPHLPRLLDTGEASGRLWFAREFVPGETLAVRLRRRGPLPVPDALSVVAQLATALDELHRQGLVHRDLKPGHVLLGNRAQGGAIVYLIDACIAAPLDASAASPSYGTAAYAAPEVAAGGPPSFRTDLYALGCVLHELLAGAPPFSSPSIRELLAAQEHQAPPALDVDMPAPVAALLATLFAKEPRRRPFSAQQVRRALDPFLPEGVPAAPNLGRTSRSLAPPPPSVASARPPNPDATVELKVEDLLPAAGSGEGAAFPTQEIELIELEPAAVAKDGVRKRTATARGGLSAPRSGQRSVDDSSPTIALITAVPADAEQSSEIDLTPLIEGDSSELPGAHPPATKPPPPKAAISSRPPAARRPTSAPPPRAGATARPPTAAPTQARAGLTAPPPPPAASSTGRFGAAGSAAPPPPPAAASAAPPSAASAAGQNGLAKPAAASASGAPAGMPPPEPAVFSAKREQPIDQDDFLAPATPAVSPEPDMLPDPPARPGRRSFKPISAEEAAALDQAGAVSPQLPIVTRATRPHFSRRPTMLLWAAAALVLLAIALRAVRGSAPELAGTYSANVLKKKPRKSYATSLHSPVVNVRVPAAVVEVPGKLKPVPAPPVAAAARQASVPADEKYLPAHASGPKPVAVARVADKDARAMHGSAAAQPTAAGQHLQPAAAGQPQALAVAPTPPTAAGAADPSATTDEPEPAAAPPPPGSVLTAAQARKGFSRKRNSLGGVVQYKGRSQPQVDYKTKARELYQAGKYREAAENYQRAAHEAPSDAAAFAGLGASWLSAREPDRAITAYQRAVQLKPEVSGFQAALGRAYLAKGDRGRSVAAYAKALALDPSNQAAKSALASLKK